MATPDARGTFDLTEILSSSVDSLTGGIVLQTGSIISGEDPRDGTELWQPSGYVARPANPTPPNQQDPNYAAQAVCIVRGDVDIAVGTADISAKPLLEPLGPGEVQIFAGGPANSGTCKVVLNNDGNGNVKVTITAGTAVVVVTSDNNGTLNVTANQVNLAQASDYAALASKVDAMFNALVTTLGSGSNSGGPVVFGKPFTPSSTAATNVKIS